MRFVTDFALRDKIHRGIPMRRLSLSLSLSTWRGGKLNWTVFLFSIRVSIFPDDRKDARQCGFTYFERIDHSPDFLSLCLSKSFLFSRVCFEHVYELLLFSWLDIFQSESEQIGYTKIFSNLRAGRRTFEIFLAYPITLHDRECSYSKYNAQSKLNFRSASELFA